MMTTHWINFIQHEEMFPPFTTRIVSSKHNCAVVALSNVSFCVGAGMPHALPFGYPPHAIQAIGCDLLFEYTNSLVIVSADGSRCLTLAELTTPIDEVVVSQDNKSVIVVAPGLYYEYHVTAVNDGYIIEPCEPVDIPIVAQ